MITQIKKNKPVNIKKAKKIHFVPYYKFEDEYGGRNTADEVAKGIQKDGDNCYVVKYFAAENKIVVIEFELLGFSTCCGMTEIGNLNATDSTGITELLDSIASSNKGHTYMITTNGRNASKYYEAALAKCKYWTKVKSFVNKNSKNTIQVWMSNNE